MLRSSPHGECGLKSLLFRLPKHQPKREGMFPRNTKEGPASYRLPAYLGGLGTAAGPSEGMAAQEWADAKEKMQWCPGPYFANKIRPSSCNISFPISPYIPDNQILHKKLHVFSTGFDGIPSLQVV